MFNTIKHHKKNFFFFQLIRLMVFVLSFSLIFSPAASYAQSINLLNLPIPGTMVNPSPAFVPVLIKGMTVHPDDPLRFDFILDSGNTDFNQDQVKEESQRLIRYFLASLTVPKDDLWVNLSPYENDRVIPEELGKTELGRDLLALDYVLKQLTASLMYPEDELGNEFWEKIYKKAQEEYGTIEIPVDTFNKVWILPEKASVYEYENTVYVVDSKLKVMLDVDYLAMEQNNVGTGLAPVRNNEENSVEGTLVGTLDGNSINRAGTRLAPTKNISTQIIREIIIPAIEKEVNEGENFANLRQIYHSLILAKWYKEKLQQSVGAHGDAPVLMQVYVDQNKVAGIDINVGANNHSPVQHIYQQYLEAFKKGVFNYIKEDVDRLSGEMIPRKYFSGGIPLAKTLDVERSASPVKETNNPKFVETVHMHPEGEGQAASPIDEKEDAGEIDPSESFDIDNTKVSWQFISDFKMKISPYHLIRSFYEKDIFKWAPQIIKNETKAEWQEKAFLLLPEILAKNIENGHSDSFSSPPSQNAWRESVEALGLYGGIEAVGLLVMAHKYSEEYAGGEYIIGEEASLGEEDMTPDGNHTNYVLKALKEILKNVGKDNVMSGLNGIIQGDQNYSETAKYLKRKLEENPSNSSIDFNSSKSEGFKSSSPLSNEVGGINMNDIDVDKQGSGSNIQFDPAAMESLLDMNIKGFVPVIINITPLPSVLPLLGLDAREEEKPLDSAQADGAQELSFVDKKRFDFSDAG